MRDIAIDILKLFIYLFQLGYNWHTILYWFQVYNVMIRYLYIVRSDQHSLVNIRHHTWLQNFYLFIYLFIYLFMAVLGLRFCARVLSSCGKRGPLFMQCAGLSLSRPLPLWSTGSRHASSVIVAHRPSCSAACGILPGEGSNPCPLHWQVDSQPLRHQGNPEFFYLWLKLKIYFLATFKYAILY